MYKILHLNNLPSAFFFEIIEKGEPPPSGIGSLKLLRYFIKL